MGVFGKRCDGTLVTHLTPYEKFFPHLVRTRSESQLLFKQLIEVDKTLRHLASANSGSNHGNITLFHVFLCAAVRTIALRPKLNRFVKGRRVYQRNSISCSFVVKKELTEDAPYSNVKIMFGPDETLEAVCEKVDERLRLVRADEANAAEKELRLVTRLPTWITSVITSIFRLLDHFGLAPKRMIQVDPLYTSVYLSHHASIGLDAPYHHLFNWGTASVFLIVGRIHKAVVATFNDEVRAVNAVTAAFTLDNRIADGIYAGSALKLFKDFVENPEKLQTPPHY
jgi:hypothetical protein